MSFWCTLQSLAQESVFCQSFLELLHQVCSQELHHISSFPSSTYAPKFQICYYCKSYLLIYSFEVIKVNDQFLQAQLCSERPSETIQYPPFPGFCWISMPQLSTGVPPCAESLHSWGQVQCLVVFSSFDTHIVNTSSGIVLLHCPFPFYRYYCLVNYLPSLAAGGTT